MYYKYKHTIVKAEVRSRSNGKMDMENMANIISKPKALLVTTREIEKGDRWIMDSGATCHMTSKLNKLSSASSCLGGTVNLPNDEFTLLPYVGKC